MHDRGDIEFDYRNSYAPPAKPIGRLSDIARSFGRCLDGDRTRRTERAKIRPMASESSTLKQNLARIQERINGAAFRARRCSAEITLIAVSKTHSAAQIVEAFEAGVRHFGENRVQEWESKRAELIHLDAAWHFIGHLQSNKVARAVPLFHNFDSVDSVSLAERINRACEGPEPRKMRVLIEVKLDPGPTKSGARDAELPELAEAIQRLPHLELRGLMGVPPYSDDLESVRPYFRHLRELRDALGEKLGQDALPVLSMGMSHDFEVAIEEGATEIRVGTALFGERPKP
jgi:pyridoxal phosphate enzyme (YggS family)